MRRCILRNASFPILLLIYIRPWFKQFKMFKSFKSIPDSSQRLERFERSAAIERLQPGIRYIARKPC